MKKKVFITTVMQEFKDAVADVQNHKDGTAFFMMHYNLLKQRVAEKHLSSIRTAESLGFEAPTEDRLVDMMAQRALDAWKDTEYYQLVPSLYTWSKKSTINTMSKESTQVTNNEILAELKSFKVETREEFKVVTALLHGVSETAQRTEAAVVRLTPAARDHEERISFLERSTARLRLLVDR